MIQTNLFKSAKVLYALILLFIPILIFSQTIVPFAKRYENVGINGDLTIIGNNIVGNNATVPFNGTNNNNNHTMVYVDIDNDATTFSSSSAALNLSNCDRIVYAGLYWGANFSATGDTPENIKFKAPGGTYQNITADLDFNDMIYYKDMTSIVTALANPVGDYFVANISCDVGNSNRAAGWSLVIVFERPGESRKFISTFDGLSHVAPGNSEQFQYSGFTTPPLGPVEGTIGIVALEGDRALIGEQLLFADSLIPTSDPNSSFTVLSDAERPATNFFNSKITIDGAQVTTRNLNSTNTLGWDIALVDLTPLNPGNSILGNNATEATVRVDTNSDRIFSFLNTFAVNIIEPILQVLTSVEDTSNNQVTLGSPIQLGETVWYNINFQNIGTDNAQNTVILNTLPINVTLDESSIILPTGVTYTFNSATRELTFNIDNSLVLRESDPANAAYDIRYQVTASNDCFDYTDACTNLLENFIESSYDGETSGQNVSGQPGLNGINGCGLGNVGSMDLFVDTSSCNFDSTEIFCNNNLTISGHDGYNIYEWRDEDNNLLAANSQTITVTGPGVYTVTQTRIGCSVTTRVITVLGLDVTLTPSDALCKDQADGKVNIEVVDTAADFTYQLSQGATVLSTVGPTTSKNHEFSGLDIGTYTIRVTNTDGCFDVQNVTISEPTLLQATNSVLDNIMPCNGNRLSGRIEVSATGGTQIIATSDYEYSMDGSAFQDSNIFETTQEGNHTMTVRDANNCTTTTVATITFDDEIEYNLTKNDVQCYQGTDGSITTNVTQNNAGNTLTYSIDGGTFQASPTFSGLAIGDYTITIRKVKGVNTCEIIESITINQEVDLQFEATGGFSCEDGAMNTITATVANQFTSDVTYTLDGSSSNSTGVFEDVSDGQHTVRVVQNSTGCSAEPVILTIEQYIPVTFEVENNGISLVEYVVNATDGVPEYQYALLRNTQDDVSPTVGDDDFGSSNVLVVSGAGFYTFYVKDTKGCIVEKIVEIEDVEIPNFFTPNDDSYNDTWHPRNIELYPDITVIIFDRYQRLITSLKGNQASWDGSYNNKLLPSGDYWYIIRLNHPNDNREFKGNITLYR